MTNALFSTTFAHSLAFSDDLTIVATNVVGGLFTPGVSTVAMRFALLFQVATPTVFHGLSVSIISESNRPTGTIRVGIFVQPTPTTGSDVMLSDPNLFVDVLVPTDPVAGFGQATTNLAPAGTTVPAGAVVSVIATSSQSIPIIRGSVALLWREL